MFEEPTIVMRVRSSLDGLAGHACGKIYLTTCIGLDVVPMDFPERKRSGLVLAFSESVEPR